MRIRLAVWVMLLGLMAGCRGPVGEIEPGRDSAPDSVEEKKIMAAVDSPMETRLREMGLVDVQELDATIGVHLVYATEENYMGEVLYRDLHKAFLLPEMAERVVRAQALLKAERPELSLMILDAARPLSIQRKMFHLVAGTPRNIYVSNPKHGPGLHNYGAAVDVTLVDTWGRLLDMGTEFDHFGPEAHTDNEALLVREGKISHEAFENRRLLRRVMKEAGLKPLRSEWWHFNLMSREQARQQLKPIDW